MWKLGDNEDLISISDSRPLPLTLTMDATSLDVDNNQKKVETIEKWDFDQNHDTNSHHGRRTSLDGDNNQKKVKTIEK